MNIPMTKHAAARQQQRGISPLIMEWLTRYGTTCHDHHGAEILYFDKQSRKALARSFGDEVVSRLGELLDTYAVVSSDGAIITVGHRIKRIKGH
jgi:hypothetical protein